MWEEVIAMRTVIYRVVLAMVLVVILVVSVAQASYITRGKVSQVTVYRSQALITRTLEVEGFQGGLQVVVTDLPERIIPSSLSAQAEAPTRIHSVTYRTEAVKGETRPEVQAIDERLAELEKKLREIQAYKELLKVKQAIIARLEEFTQASAQAELQRGILNFEELRKLTEYGLAKYDEFLQEHLRLEEEEKETTEEIKLMRRKRSQLAAGYSETKREAVVYLTKDTDQPVAISLRYLVDQVGWYPEYNLQAQEEENSLTLEYNAIVRQTSGENWDKVQVILSTAQPTFNAQPPLIEPLPIGLGAKRILKEKELEKSLEGFQKQRSAVQQAPTASPEVSAMLNVVAAEEQVLELTQKEDVLAAAKRKTRPTEGVSVTYSLPDSVSLASRSDEQILQIASVRMPASFRYKAAPLLTDFVFQEASAKNTSSYVFLPGTYNSFLNGEFVGRGKLKLLAAGEEFTSGFGVDPQLQVRRELVAKNERIEGGNLVSELEYRLTISSYRDRAIPLVLEDRIPYSPDGVVQIRLLESKPELSQDPEYQRTDFKKGILRWDLEIPAQAIDNKATVVIYRFSIAHDKDATVQGKS